MNDLLFFHPVVMLTVCRSGIENQYSPSYLNILRPAFNRNTRNFGNGPLLMVKKEKGKESFSTRSLPLKKGKEHESADYGWALRGQPCGVWKILRGRVLFWHEGTSVSVKNKEWGRKCSARGIKKKNASEFFRGAAEFCGWHMGI